MAMSTPVTSDQLKTVKLFQNCNQSTLDSIKQMLKPKSFGKGEYIVRHNEVAKEMFFLMQGQVDIFSSSSTKIDHASEGSCFGELGLVYSIPRTASVQAITDVVVWVLEKSDFEKVKALSPEIDRAIQSIAENRFKRFQRILSALADTPEGDNFDPEQLNVFREVFYYFDKSHNNVLSVQDLGEMLYWLGGKKENGEKIEYKPEEVAFVAKLLDPHNKEGGVSYDSFVLKLRMLAWLCDPNARRVKAESRQDDSVSETEWISRRSYSRLPWFVLVGMMGFALGYIAAAKMK